MMSKNQIQRIYSLRPRQVVPPYEETPEQILQRLQGHIVSSKWNVHDRNPLSKETPAPPPFQPRPILSPLNLCYQNALTQALFHIPKVANWLKFHHLDCKAGPWCVACALRALLDYYWTLESDQSKSERTRTAKELLRICQGAGDALTEGWRSGGSQQEAWKHDLEEFYRNNPDHEREDFGENAQEDVQEYWLYIHDAFKRQLDLQSGELAEAIFSMGVQYSWKCPYCSDTHVNNLVYNDSLQLNFPADLTATQHTLPQLLQHHFDPAQNSVDYIDCSQPSCLKRVRSPPRHLILKVAPDVLIIHLVRFRKDMYGGHVKIETPVHFSQKLNMSPYYAGPRNSLRYHLVSVIQQRGELGSGHYVTVARDPRGQWFELDDNVEPSRVPFRRAFNPGRGFTPYLLFYKRILREKAVYPIPVPELGKELVEKEEGLLIPP